MEWAGAWRPKGKGRAKAGTKLYRAALYDRLRSVYSSYRGASDTKVDGGITSIKVHDSMFTVTKNGKYFPAKIGDVVLASFRGDEFKSNPVASVYKIRGKLVLMIRRSYMRLS
jgi:hypothetical protein